MREELTQKDVERIREEIEHRSGEVRTEILDALKEARAQGDLSENFEYYAAKRENRRNNSRINYLERMLRTAKIISDESKDDEVGLNNTVEVYMPEDDETEEYRLVTSIRGDSLSGKITIESPLGKALMGHKVGDTVIVRVNENYSYPVQIRAIRNTGDDGTDQIRSY
ncbi:MAG: transcription elongation factor GreA [Lachnospiraceae bacterium]|nr:transcription elongation factor GreA [Lachnospiraceae bacterium]